MLSACECKQKKCDMKIKEEERKQLYLAYWSMGYNERRHWLYSHMQILDVNRRYSVEEYSRRNATRFYFFPDFNATSNKKIFVCKQMFLITLAYKSDKILTTAANSVDNYGIYKDDQRGKREPHNKLTEERINFIKDHILSFNPSISHYRREHAPKRLYLPPFLSIIAMYTNYKEKCSKITFQPVSYDKYVKVVSAMNISCAKLGDERCEECEAHKLHLKENEEEYSEEMDEEERCSKVLKEKRRKINLPEILYVMIVLNAKDFCYIK